MVVVDRYGHKGVLEEEQLIRGGPMTVSAKASAELFNIVAKMKAGGTAKAMSTRIGAVARDYEKVLKEERSRLELYAGFLLKDPDKSWDFVIRQLYELSFEPVLRELFLPFASVGSGPLYWGPSAEVLMRRGESPLHVLQCIWGFYRVRWNTWSKGTLRAVLLHDPHGAV